ncbi:hypothetical protein Zmor_017508 [Zophobas morio]|uniref:Reverse transcriptase domain-containing protein n=1 Tax=Zophobas morio TaxID=2755281 RepID=A0AA38MC85_9CUCU|nr:hypothetical protein Zmor_017508 [Zophobas morio]
MPLVQSIRMVTTNLLQCIDDWTKAFESRIPVDVIYLDFSKAFDRIPKRRLLLKLRSYGVTGTLLSWIEAYLSTRSFKVRVGQTFSILRPVTSGVPQGSVLGPLLFIIYIADLPKLISSKSPFFADDSKIYDHSSNHDNIQEDLNIIYQWCETWLLPLNTDKCTVLYFGPDNPMNSYWLGNHRLKEETSHCDLGVTVTNKLEWSTHIANICNKANRQLYLISRTFVSLNIALTKKLYITYVRPILDYCGSVWSCDLIRDTNQLEAVQRRATRLPFGRTRPSYEERLEMYGLDTIANRRSRGDQIFTFKVLHNIIGSNLAYMYRLNINDRLRRHQFNLIKERTSSRSRSNFLVNRVVNQWNSLPDTIVNSPSVNCFKNRFDAFNL